MDVKLYPAPLAGTVAAPPSKSRWHRELICQAAAGRFPPFSPDAPEDSRATASGQSVRCRLDAEEGCATVRLFL